MLSGTNETSSPYATPATAERPYGRTDPRGGEVSDTIDSQVLQNIIIRRVLKTMTHGDKGSTLLGVLAACLLAANIDFATIAAGDKNKRAVEIAKACAVVALVLWGRYIGKEDVAQLVADAEQEGRQ